ncbi:MAG: hypothetical protein RSB05_06560, partial [Clostridiales bacterium]
MIAFLVVGPKDMVKVARFLGRTVRKAQDMMSDIKASVNEASESNGLKDVKDTVDSLKQEVDKLNPINDLKNLNPLNQIKNDIKEELNPISDLKSEID